MTGRAVAGGGRGVLVPPERLARWLDGFAGRHGAVTVTATADEVRATAADGATATVAVPLPPLPRRPPTWPEPVDGAADTAWESLVAEVGRPRVLGLLLVRLGGYAAGVAEGHDLVAARGGSRPVHARAAAGGWSQQRFARRRDGQVRVALAAAADLAAEVLLPRVADLEALVTGGDRAAVTTVLGDPRLAGLRPLLRPGLLDVVDPRRAALPAALLHARSVEIVVREGEPTVPPARAPEPG